MQCACIYVDSYDDQVTLLFEKTVKANKQHKCSECGMPIKKKEHYYREEYVCENEIAVHKTCLSCKSIRDVLFCEGWYYGMIWGLLREHLIEVGINDACFGEDILELNDKAKQEVLKLMEEIAEDYPLTKEQHAPMPQR